MEARKLKTLLRTLQEFGVTSYQDADVTLNFGGPVAPAGGDVTGEMKGAPDVVNPRDHILRLYEKAKPRSAS